MPSSSLFQLGAAVYKALASDATLKNLATRVFDSFAPTDTAYPYVVVGEWTEVADDVLTRPGREVTCTIHVFSRYQGSAELKRIIDRVEGLLSRVILTVPEWNVLTAMLDYVNTLVESDLTQHGVVRFKWRLSPK